MDPLNVLEFEDLARERMESSGFDYFASGAENEITLGENQSAYDRLRLFYRVLVDVSHCSPATEVLGTPISLPILVAPTAFHKLACPEGELATVRAASTAGSLMILSTLSNTPVEEVVAESDVPVWFQLYVYRDREATRALVARIEAAGCRALVLTVDAPLLGRRERDMRNRFQLPPGMFIENMLSEGLGNLPAGSEGSGLAAYFAPLLDPSLSYKDIDWLRSITDLPILVKGIVRADDAVQAVEHGAAGIVVSNHGGRQLDTAPATIDVLEEVVEAVDGRAEILIDGGVRRGTDVVKALGLGAKAVLVGRPILWGLAAAGQEGAEKVLEIFRQELDLAMALCGCPTVADIRRDLVR